MGALYFLPVFLYIWNSCKKLSLLRKCHFKKKVEWLFKRDQRDTLTSVIWTLIGEAIKVIIGTCGEIWIGNNIGWFIILLSVRMVLWLNGRMSSPLFRDVVKCNDDVCNLPQTVQEGKKHIWREKQKWQNVRNDESKWKVYWHSSYDSFTIFCKFEIFQNKILEKISIQF